LKANDNSFLYLRHVMKRKKKIEIPLILVELENENYHILIETKFSDNEPQIWVIDTGASKTVLDINLINIYTEVETPLTEIESMGIGDTGIETKSGIIGEMKLGNESLYNLNVALIDLSQLNILYHRFTNKKISGLIGSDFLVRYKAAIDFKKLVLTLFI
jgi:hypothetical protein